MQAIVEELDYTLLAAALLTVLHALGPHIRKLFRRQAELVSSFGGGLAVAYVFLHVLPEIEGAHEWLGDRVHFITLISFLLFFVLEVWLVTRHEGATANAPMPRVSGGDHGETGESMAQSPSAVFWCHLTMSWLYTWMVVFAFPEQVGQHLTFALVATLAVGLHLIYKDYVLRRHYADDFDVKGRYLLALAPITGWLAHRIVEPPEVVFELFIAVLAGILMQGVFREELPSRQATRIGWMIGGAATFTALSFLTA